MSLDDPASFTSGFSSVVVVQCINNASCKLGGWDRLFKGKIRYNRIHIYIEVFN